MEETGAVTQDEGAQLEDPPSFNSHSIEKLSVLLRFPGFRKNLSSQMVNSGLTLLQVTESTALARVVWVTEFSSKFCLVLQTPQLSPAHPLL